MAFTLDQLCTRASALTGLTDYAGTTERTLMEAWANEGIAQVFQDTQCVITDVNVGLTAGVDEYALDRGVISVLNWAQSANAPSARITVMNAADIIERKFLSSTGTVRYFAVLGGNLLIVSPAPDTADTIKFYAVPVPDIVTATQDIFITSLPTYAQRAVECYLNARCFEQARDYQQSSFWDKQYTDECGKIRVTMRKQAGRTLPASRIGYPDYASTPSRNDTYPRS
jgi:hypothetical protein